MAQAYKISTAVANAKADAAVDLVDGGAADGHIVFYAGTVPATANTALDIPATHTILADMNFSDPAFGASVAGEATANAIDAGVAVADGTATFFRVYDSDDNELFQGTCGTADADAIMNSVSVQDGADFTVSSYVHRQPLA